MTTVVASSAAANVANSAAAETVKTVKMARIFFCRSRGAKLTSTDDEKRGREAFYWDKEGRAEDILTAYAQHNI
ncbi:hypothetical protein niasHT_002638 [Heterodera trifolii]|uniref:Uncharacterized protein n=1 Tax=Heterodera trifolii TaxID=157864 RepID=A0ABD2LUA4_9BILA